MNNKLIPAAVCSALVAAVAATSDERGDRPPVSIGGLEASGARPLSFAPGAAASNDPALGEVLWDNGLTFLTGVSHLTVPAHRSIIDDFEVTGPGWTMSAFQTKFAWSDGTTGTGADTEITVYADLDGAPDFDRLVCAAENRVYEEVRDPSNPDFFGLTIMDITLTFDDITLAPGVYWVDMHVVGPINGFQVVGAYPQSMLQPCWVDYRDFGGRQRGWKVFGDNYDVTFQLVGSVCSADCPAFIDEFTVIFGDLGSGDADDLRKSDDAWVVLEPRPALTASLPLIRAQFQATAPFADASEVTLAVESGSDAIPTRPPQRLSLFDYDAGVWVTVDERVTTFNDSVTEVTVDLQAGRFIEPGTRAITPRAEYFNPGNVFRPSWVVRLDQVRLLVTP